MLGICDSKLGVIKHGPRTLLQMRTRKPLKRLTVTNILRLQAAVDEYQKLEAS